MSMSPFVYTSCDRGKAQSFVLTSVDDWQPSDQVTSGSSSSSCGLNRLCSIRLCSDTYTVHARTVPTRTITHWIGAIGYSRVGRKENSNQVSLYATSFTFVLWTKIKFKALNYFVRSIYIQLLFYFYFIIKRYGNKRKYRPEEKTWSQSHREKKVLISNICC